MSDLMILQADARKIPLADGVVQCVVTSPPYWGLRKYAGAQDLIWPSGATNQRGTSTTGLMMTCDEIGHEWAEESRAGIMGYPLGWTALEDSATRSSRKSRNTSGTASGEAKAKWQAVCPKRKQKKITGLIKNT